MLGDERRAWVDFELRNIANFCKFGVQATQNIRVVLQGRAKSRWRRCFGCYFFRSSLRPYFGGCSLIQCLKKPENTVFGLAAGLGVVTIKPVQPGTRVGVDHAQGCVFAAQVFAQRNQGGVFEDIGMVAGVKGVAIRKHGCIFAAKPVVETGNIDVSP